MLFIHYSTKIFLYLLVKGYISNLPKVLVPPLLSKKLEHMTFCTRKKGFIWNRRLSYLFVVSNYVTQSDEHKNVGFYQQSSNVPSGMPSQEGYKG